MRAAVCHSFGADLSGLAMGEVASPVSQPGQVLVDVQVASVTFMDVLMAWGKYQMQPSLPYVSGTDAAGVMCAAGERSRGSN